MDLRNEYIFDGLFGLERETLRVTDTGAPAQTPHPFSESYLTRDFCENQLEIITPACESISLLMKSLKQLDSYARTKLANQNEYLWLNSNPPRISSEDDIPIARFTGEQAFKYEYREKLQRRYGKRLMLYSGIHFNFSFSDELMSSLYDGKSDYGDFKNTLYFRLSKQVFRYSWLIVLLTSASPLFDLSLHSDGMQGTGFDSDASGRNGKNGYWNKFIPILDYTNLNTYINSINSYVSDGTLFSPSELYLPMRLKPSDSSSHDMLIRNGVDHIELRMFDVNPLAPLGVFEEDLHFAHYFLLYLTQLPDFEFTPELQKAAVENHKAAAGYDLGSIVINGYPARNAAMGLLEDMSEYFKGFPRIIKSIDREKNKISQDKRYCKEIYSMLNEDFHSKMLKIIK